MRTAVLGIAVVFVGGHSAAAELLPQWSISGTNTLRYEHYRATGDLTASPYPSLGSQSFDEFHINGHLRNNPYDQWRVQLSGVASDSAYRTSKTGAEIERFSVVRERGDSGLPYRAEVGDFFGFYSLGTLQQAMKGGQVDLQWSEGKRRQSLQLTAGAFQQAWRNFDPHRDYAFGGSWLVDDSDLGRFGLSLLNNRREADTVAGIAGRDQWVGSLAGEKALRHKWGATTVEGEIAHFRGDHNTAANRRDAALTLQASGRANAFNYRFRLERIGQDYQPRAGILASDRRAVEGYLGYRFASGMDLRLRQQEFISAWESANPSTSRTTGATLSGRLLSGLLPKLNGSVDTFVQDSFDRSQTVSTTTHFLGATLAHPLGTAVGARFNGSLLDSENHIAGRVGTTTTQLGAAIDFPMAVSGFKGTASLGAQWRDVRQASAGNRDVSPTLNLNLARGQHSVSMNISSLDQDNRNAATADVFTSNVQAAYRYTSGQHTLGLEYLRNGRQPSPGLGTVAHQFVAYWSVSLDRPSPLSAGPATAGFAVAGGAGAPVADRPLLIDLRPGLKLAEVRSRLADARILGETRVGRLAIYNTPVLDDIPQAQTLVLAGDGDNMDKAVLIIDFDDPSSAQGIIATFERVRRHFLDRLGSPQRFFERGSVGAGVPEAIRQGSFIRVSDWQTEGGWLRLGMPRRMDGKVRIEVHFAAGMFPSESDTAWGLAEY